MTESSLSKKEESSRIQERTLHFKSWTLTARQLCDLELLMQGAFAPLTSFLGSKDYDSVCSQMRLVNGLLWPIPITLDVSETFASSLHLGETIALRDIEGLLLALLTVEEQWKPNLLKEAQEVYQTTSLEHPGVAYLLQQSHPIYLSGSLEVIEPPTHHDFQNLRYSPQALRAEFQKRGWQKIIAFQTRNPLHRAHIEMTQCAMQKQNAQLLIHPAVGLTKPGDVDYYTRVRCYQAVLPYYPQNSVQLALLPLAMRMGGPREALWHALIRKNYGCTHFIVGRDHAGPGKDSQGRSFYGPYQAQELLEKYQSELAIQILPFKVMLYVQKEDKYYPEDQIPSGSTPTELSGTQLRERLHSGKEIPSWFTYPEVLKELKRLDPSRTQQGLTLFFTGLPSAGKSTIAKILQSKLLEEGSRTVTLLDGDLVRQMLSSELTFSKEHRDLNIRRIGFVASEITKHKGIAICAPIAPYDSIRQEVKKMIEKQGNFILIYVATPLEICEQRDRKGLYAKARKGIISNFTGVSDPYEIPVHPEIQLDTHLEPPEDSVKKIMDYLKKQGYLATP